MHARMVNITGTDVAGVLKYLQENVVPVVAEQKGFHQIGVSGDRSAGVINILTVWDSKAELEATDEIVGKFRQDALAKFGGEATFGVFEQVLMEMGRAPPGPGCVLRLLDTKIDPSKLDDNLASFRNEVAPMIKAMPGFRALRQLINRQTGEGRVGTVFSDRASMDAGRGARAQRMAEARERGVEFTADRVLEILFTKL